jgi:Domain of unknown function (DUF4142)
MRPTTVAASAVLALLLGAAPSRAASVTTDDFVAILGPSADYIVASSDLAASAGGSRTLRAAAKTQAAAARALLADLAAWHVAQARAEDAAAHAPTIDGLGPAFAALSVPLEAVARTASSPGYFFTRLPSAGRLEDAGHADYARLSTLAGAPFDALYVETDLAALLRLENACKDFVLNGDDETLRAIAVHALPKLRHEIAMLKSAA